MIIRIVKLTFDKSKVNDFLTFINTYKEQIRRQKGCLLLEMLQDRNNAGIVFTRSYWDSQEDLDNYRESKLFQEIWSYTKTLFVERPEAWSTQSISLLE